MKKSLIFAALLLAPAFAGAETPAVPGVSPETAPAPVAGPASQANPPARRARLLERFDTDKDGKLSKSERQAAGAKAKQQGNLLRDRVMDQFDADKDGKLSPSERETAQTALKEKGSALRDRAMEQFDADKDGQLSEAERATLKAAVQTFKEKRGGAVGDERRDGKAAARQQRLLEQFDADKDGQLSEAERAQARAARHEAARP